MSQLLMEVYRFLHIKPIRTTPYHPQTDGLVERFNQTLKAMLRKMTLSGEQSWDKLLPYVLFAYREVPQASTGFSPFELLYGRKVRGLLDVLREVWEEPTKGGENVIIYMLAMRNRLGSMTEMVQENLSHEQKVQKRWYDKTARCREFHLGDQVLVLLPTSTHKFQAQWQGPYTVMEKRDDVDYVIDMGNRRKRLQMFHVNMLRRWHESKPLSLYSEDAPDDEVNNIVLWNKDDCSPPAINPELSEAQIQDMCDIITEFSDVFSTKFGRTNLAEHGIKTGTANPVRQAPYRLPHAYREDVKKDLEEMEKDGIIEPSASEWSVTDRPGAEKRWQSTNMCGLSPIEQCVGS